MANCIYCGAQIPDNAKFCTTCGAALPVEAAPVQQPIEVPAEVVPEQPPVQSYQQQVQQSFEQPQQQAYQQPQQQYQQPQQAQPTFAAPEQPAVNDTGSIGWGVLGAFFPIVGIILFFVWKNTKPKTAKVAIIGAAIGVVISLVFNVFSGNTTMSMFYTH